MLSPGSWDTIETESWFLYDGWSLVYERRENGINNQIDWNNTPQLERHYLWGLDSDGSMGGLGGVGGMLSYTEVTQGTTETYLPTYDGRGNVTALVRKRDNAVVAKYAYGPYGEQIKAEGEKAASNPWRFATKYQDAETGFYYFGFRYYDTKTGNWLSREPLGESESINLYAYCHNDPINNVDYLGLSAVMPSEEELERAFKRNGWSFESFENSFGVRSGLVRRKMADWYAERERYGRLGKTGTPYKWVAKNPYKKPVQRLNMNDYVSLGGKFYFDKNRGSTAAAGMSDSAAEIAVDAGYNLRKAGAIGQMGLRGFWGHLKGSVEGAFNGEGIISGGMTGYMEGINDGADVLDRVERRHHEVNKLKREAIISALPRTDTSDIIWDYSRAVPELGGLAFGGRPKGFGKVDEIADPLAAGGRNLRHARQTGADSYWDDFVEQEKLANQMYDAIRASKTDVAQIAANTGIKPENILKVKQHLFMEKHLLDRYVDYGVPAEWKRFDADVGIAKIWERLRTGNYSKMDMDLLKHEAAEAWYFRKHGQKAGYSEAHDAAQNRYPAPSWDERNL